MEFKGKLFSGSILARLAQIWALNFFLFLWFLSLLDVGSYHRMKFQGRRIIQTQENGEKPHFESDLGPLVPNSGHQLFFQKYGFATH